MSTATDLHEKMLEAIQNRDLDWLRELYHHDCVYTSGNGQELKGPEAVLGLVQVYLNAFPDLSFEIRRRYGCGADVSVTEYTARGTHKGALGGIPATGRKTTVLVCDVIEIHEGRIRQEREYFDNMALLQQLGVAPDA